MEGVLEINPDRIETVATNGLELPYVEMDTSEPALKVIHEGEEYWYYRTLPLRGYGAVLARYARQLLAEGNKPILVRFQPGPNFQTSRHWERLYIYATGVTPIGAGKK
jgi:hypothetical protein